MSRLATVTALALLAGSGLGCGGGGRAESDPIVVADRTVRASLASDNEWLRAETVRLVGAAASETYVEVLHASLDDPSPMVQTAAVEALLRAGNRDVEQTAFGRLVSGTVEQRVRLLELVVSVGRPAFRSEMILRGLRDLSPEVRVRALRHAVATETTLGLPELQRLLTADEADVATEAFLALVHFDRPRALDLVLEGLGSTDDTQRARSLAFARHIPSSSLWPMMRSYALVERESPMRRLALLVLGHLGDPVAEEGLRGILLSPDPEAAAEALTALSHIPTPRAHDQPLVHRRDARPIVRRAALDALIRQGRPTDDFEPFVEDSDPDIAKAALVHMQRTDPQRAAGLFALVLEDARDREAVLAALYRVSLQIDIRPFLDASASRLTEYLDDEDPAVRGLAARLLILASSPAEMEERVRRMRSPEAQYALIEATYADPGPYSRLYAEAFSSDLHAIRTAAALGIVALGDAYVVPEPEPEPES